MKIGVGAACRLAITAPYHCSLLRATAGFAILELSDLLNILNNRIIRQLSLSTIAVDKFVDKLLTRRISRLFVRIFSFLANFCAEKKVLTYQRNK
jgi:hypothetical protein